MENRVLTSSEGATPQKSWTLPSELRQLAQDGDVELVREVFSIFQTDSSSRLEELRGGLTAGDRQLIRRQAHALKGSAGQIGADVMAQICLQMEQTAETATPAELSSLLGALEIHFTELCQGISALDCGDLCYGG